MTLDLQLASAFNQEVPAEELVRQWVDTTLNTVQQPLKDLTIRVVDEAEITDLNSRYRQKNSPTNVLAFPFEPIDGIAYSHLGDIVICYPVVKTESNQQDIAFIYHFAHMVIHGILHLCGFDHLQDDEAAEMEAVEKGILANIKFQI